MMDVDAAKAFFRASPFMVDLGIEPVAVSAARMTTLLPLAARHMQHTGQVHAGVITTMAITAAKEPA